MIVIIKRKYKKEDNQCKLNGKAKMKKEEEKKCCTQMKINTNANNIAQIMINLNQLLIFITLCISRE